MTTARACVNNHKEFSAMHVERGEVMMPAPTMDTIAKI